MVMPLFISGLIIGFLIGVFSCYTLIQWLSRQRVRGRKREVDQLTDQFQELFRKIDQDKNPKRVSPRRRTHARTHRPPTADER